MLPSRERFVCNPEIDTASACLLLIVYFFLAHGYNILKFKLAINEVLDWSLRGVSNLLKLLKPTFLFQLSRFLDTFRILLLKIIAPKSLFHEHFVNIRPRRF